MARLAVLLALAVSVLLVACGGAGAEGEALTTTTIPTDDAISGQAASQGLAMPAPIPASAPLSVPRPSVEAMEAFDIGLALTIPMEELAPGVLALETVERQVISMASVSIEVEDVQGAVTRVRLIAEGLGVEAVVPHARSTFPARMTKIDPKRTRPDQEVLFH